MKKGKWKWAFTLGLSAAFVLWTVLVKRVDVQPVGPLGSCVGFAALNKFVHESTGVHMLLYTMTDWLSIIPVGVCAGFALLGLVQWVRRKSIWRVDGDILALGAFYALILVVYLAFEKIGINFRPVLIGGILEASYPSSTTVLVLCVMLTAAMQIKIRVRKWQGILQCANLVFTLFMIAGRMWSGVHWMTDIIGAILMSFALVQMYAAVIWKKLY